MTKPGRELWYDCPTCPSCDCSNGVPLRAAHDRHRGKPGDRIICPACGTGWVGTDAELLQAERAQAAWDLECGADDPDGTLAALVASAPPKPDPRQGGLFPEARP